MTQVAPSGGLVATLDMERGIQQVLRLDEDIRSLGGQVDKYITLVGLVVAATITVSLAADEPRPLIAVLAPYALAFLLAFLAQIYTDIEIRIRLRERIEQVLGAQQEILRIQAEVISSGYRNRLSVRLGGAILAAGYCASVVVSVVQASLVFSDFWTWLHYASLLLSAVPPVVAMWELQTCGRDALKSVSID